ncbi:YaeQ family protein [Erwinia psidii]|uniref:YaeQ family protein n=1 Tax=Erwinia psidii TaxID=69224 RepID=A0A3N6RYW0_9GAMM|nr:YaeQ family protein [Erwinia psidii]MCX8957741.1 YaeQ family protein [Erwinia psidii]MCX8960790.1 YaeQ family protein [Erwinia psidii]MCX8964970.1 YaeQ family protein [Erwinia psidii]RQM38358.1 YaeQ family protein [Erwinia psidii]
MALKATIYKAMINIADMDRHVFIDSNLTLARHPSETEERLMLRLLAWLVNADERLVFTRGLSAEDEPEIWRMNDHNGIEVWVELGLPDERRIKKACNRAASVFLYAYNARAAQIWWQQNQRRLAQLENLSVRFLDDHQMQALAGMAARSMHLQATVQDGTIWLSDEKNHLELRFTDWLKNGNII